MGALSSKVGWIRLTKGKVGHSKYQSTWVPPDACVAKLNDGWEAVGTRIPVTHNPEFVWVPDIQNLYDVYWVDGWHVYRSLAIPGEFLAVGASDDFVARIDNVWKHALKFANEAAEQYPQDVPITAPKIKAMVTQLIESIVSNHKIKAKMTVQDMLPSPKQPEILRVACDELRRKYHADVATLELEMLHDPETMVVSLVARHKGTAVPLEVVKFTYEQVVQGIPPSGEGPDFPAEEPLAELNALIEEDLAQLVSGGLLAGKFGAGKTYTPSDPSVKFSTKALQDALVAHHNANIASVHDAIPISLASEMVDSFHQAHGDVYGVMQQIAKKLAKAKKDAEDALALETLTNSFSGKIVDDLIDALHLGPGVFKTFWHWGFLIWRFWFQIGQAVQLGLYQGHNFKETP